jgi:hypothetical protein
MRVNGSKTLKALRTRSGLSKIMSSAKREAKLASFLRSGMFSLTRIFTNNARRSDVIGLQQQHFTGFYRILTSTHI